MRKDTVNRQGMNRVCSQGKTHETYTSIIKDALKKQKSPSKPIGPAADGKIQKKNIIRHVREHAWIAAPVLACLLMVGMFGLWGRAVYEIVPAIQHIFSLDMQTAIMETAASTDFSSQNRLRAQADQSEFQEGSSPVMAVLTKTAPVINTDLVVKDQAQSLVLVNTQRLQEKSIMRATIRDASGNEGDYGVGDAVAGGHVLGIFPDEVKLQLDGRIVFLKTDAASQVSGEKIDVQSANVQMLARRLEQADKSIMREMLAGVRLVPDRRNGFQVQELDSTSPLYGAGLRSGDYLQAIGGAPLYSRADMMKAMLGISGGTMEIAYMHNGRTSTGVVRIN